MTRRERIVVFLVAAVQFVNILDFVMVMPLGPDFAQALGIPTSKIGMIGGSYTAAAAVAGLVSSLFLDKFDRRPALGIAMLGLVIGTAMGGFATSLNTLMLARVLAGIFGGPATSLSLSIVADVVPPERRGKAMGIVMGAFSVAQIVGVYVSLEVSRLIGWRAPFFGLSVIGLFVALFAVFLLPPMRAHLAAVHKSETTFLQLASQRTVLLSWLMTLVAMAGTFLLVPSLSPYIQFNLGYPREHLGFPYFIGGFVSLVSLQAAGWAVDRYGAFRVGTFGTVLIAAICTGGFLLKPPLLPVVAIIAGFMMAMSFRNCAYNALTSRVPSSADRARFMSIQSTIQHVATSGAAFMSSVFLVELPDHKLQGMERLALIAMTISLTVPLLLRAVEGAVRSREARGPAPALAPAH